MSTKFKCEACKRIVNMKDTKVKERKAPEGLIQVYMECPRCNVKHHVAFIDEHVKEIREVLVHEKDPIRRALIQSKLREYIDALNHRG